VGAFLKAADTLVEAKSFDALAGAAPFAELNALFAADRDAKG